MSILFAMLVGLFFSFFPVVMNVYYKSSSGVTLLNGLLCVIGFFSLGITTLIALIIAMISVGFVNSLKSILFAIVLAFISFMFIAAELTAFIALVS